MIEIGKRASNGGLETCGLSTSGTVAYNFGAARLVESALARGEANLTADGALLATTGRHTGRSPKDKHIVRDAKTDATVWWDNNRAMSPSHFDALYADFRAHLSARDLFVQDLIGGADRDNSLRVRVVNE